MLAKITLLATTASKKDKLMNAMLDPRIGMLGIRAECSGVPKNKLASWNVTMRFAHPAWDEVEGIVYAGVVAACKSDAIKNTRKQAENDGHACRGRGRYWFTAVEAE